MGGRAGRANGILGREVTHLARRRRGLVSSRRREPNTNTGRLPQEVPTEVCFGIAEKSASHPEVFRLIVRGSKIQRLEIAGGVGGLRRICFVRYTGASGRDDINRSSGWISGLWSLFHNGTRDSKCFYINAASNRIHRRSGQSLTTPCVNDTTTEQNELSACHF